MENNFKDPETGEEFFFASHRIGFVGSTPIYKDSKGDRLVNPKTGNFLELIPKKRESYKGIAIFASETDRNKKDIRHYAKVAADHNKSEEVQHQKHKAMEKQFGKDIADTTAKVEAKQAKNSK